ncbi:hypothetical protein GCM10023153_24720 [Ornithinibacter aureus]|uniref:Uncharacterized protein n=1 Tax=Ornithinibacter aureus TaxID=622664 RepID=A0ABP8K103_9MICO|nr:hypothetical protein [Ornithinibacter aureus]KAF0833082.1 hypothetical protein C8E84_0854 [Ornithinibacter aureus]
MTARRLTEELAAWSASLAAHEYPPVILERLALFTVDGLVPLDWADQEARQRQASERHLRALKALEARQHELLARSTATVRRHTEPFVRWAP